MPKLSRLEKLAVVNAFGVVASGHNLLSHVGSIFDIEEAKMPGVYGGNANITVREFIDDPKRWLAWMKDNLTVRMLRDISFWEALVQIAGPFIAINILKKVKVLRGVGRWLNQVAGYIPGV